MAHYSSKAIVQLLRAIEQRTITLQEATGRNTLELAEIRQSIERLETNLATHTQADPTTQPLDEDIDHPTPGKDISVRQFLDVFSQLVGEESAEQHFTFAKSLAATVIQNAKLKFPGTSDHGWSHLPVDQQN
jgi:hypothetical protein